MLLIRDIKYLKALFYCFRPIIGVYCDNLKTVDILNMFNPTYKNTDKVTLSKQEYDNLLSEIKRLKQLELELNTPQKNKF